MESLTEIRVRYAETDQMGIVHHSAYVVWMELGRSDWLRERGQSYAEWEAMGIRLVVNGVQLTYRAPALYDELVQVRTWIKEAGRRKIIFGYRIERGGVRLADGESTHLVADSQNRATVLPEGLMALLKGDAGR
jgi:acyl-CoA thioester hydrolase